jgi:hypothetical protein
LKQYAPLSVVSEIENSKIITDKNIDNDQDSKSKKTVSWEDSEIEILKKQIRDLFKKMDKMQEEIDVLKYTKDIIEQEEITEKSI